MTTFPIRPLAAALALAAVLFTTPAPAGAQDSSPDAGRAAGRRHGRVQRGQMRDRLAQELGLTQEQRDRIDQIRQGERDAMRDAHRALAEKRQALRDTMLADPTNQAAIDARARDLDAARADVQRRMLSVQQQVFQVLTPEQRDRARTMLQEHRSERKQRLSKSI